MVRLDPWEELRDWGEFAHGGADEHSLGVHGLHHKMNEVYRSSAIS
jgi:hypothetical protein